VTMTCAHRLASIGKPGVTLSVTLESFFHSATSASLFFDPLELRSSAHRLSTHMRHTLKGVCSNKEDA